MRKGSLKKDRRKKPRRSVGNSPKKDAGTSQEQCCQCGKAMVPEDRVLFVEEEVGRVFCSEGCISSYFSPEVDRLEKEYFRKLSSNDLSADEREKLAHLRWITLEEPDEVWREKTLAGDYRYTLVSEFQPGSKPLWCVCICLLLRGEPSFLFLAFPTQNAAMVDAYRRGERVQWSKPKKEAAYLRNPLNSSAQQGTPPGGLTDGLADAWTEEETLRAQLIQGRRADDIPLENFSLYQACLEETLEGPDEVWSLQTTPAKGRGPVRLYHFIRHYPEENPQFWFIIVARETEDEEQIEILDSFPTKDADLVERYRQGEQEVGSQDPIQTPSRLIH